MEALLRAARRIRRRAGSEALWRRVRPWYWQAVRSVAGGRGVRMRLSDGRRYRLDPALFAWTPERYEPDVVAALTRYLQPAGVFYDVGAHVGLVTLMAAHAVGPSGRVVAFEPSPGNFAMLRQHLAANGFLDRVEPVQALVGETNAPAVPFVARSGEFTANSLAYAVDGGTEIAVPMLTLDRYTEGQTPPTVLKIDVEGYELAVLDGAREVLERHRPVIVCALHPEPLAALGAGTADVIALLVRHGYRVSDLAGRPKERAGFEEVLAMPGERCS